MRPCVLSLATSLFPLILMHVFPTYIVIFSLSLPQSLPFLFSHLSEPFFSSVPHFQLLTLVIRLGITCLNKCRPPSLVECSLSAAQSPELHARSQTCLCGKRYFFSFHWCNSRLDTETKTPLTYPRGPCLILYSHRICVQGLFYYLLMCDSLETAGRW